MTQGASRSVARQIESLFDLGVVGGLSDRQLVDRFNAQRDAGGEAAFAAMVQRHGPMVLEICRQFLGDAHHAEDAFQAVFLVLARKAGSLRDPDRLGTWLYGVAIRTARKARARQARARRNEEADAMNRPGPEAAGTVEATSPTAESTAIGREQAAALHDEIDRLPRSFRLPVVLCYFEGLTLDEAAHRLRWPAGTVRSRLARARDKLRRGLTRRGVVLPAAALAAALGRGASAAPVPPALCAATTRAALGFAAGQAVPASVALLARDVIGSTWIPQAIVGVAAGLALAAGAGIWAHGAAKEEVATPIAPVAIPARVEPQAKVEPPAPVREPTPAVAVRVPPVVVPERRLSPWGEQVDRAIRGGVRFLMQQQRPDGSWPDVEGDARTGTTSLVTLALLAAGETPESPAVHRALEALRSSRPDDLRSTYAIGLQTMVYAAADLPEDRLRIAANVEWLERAQIKPEDGVPWPGSWTYNDFKRGRHGDGSNTQYALLGLHAAAEVGVPVKPEVWTLASVYWTRAQKKDGSWAYTADSPASTASMTCAGVTGLVLSGLRHYAEPTFMAGMFVRKCGRPAESRDVMSGIDWLAASFQVGQNFGSGPNWRFYYLYGLERAGRMAGVRFVGAHDWYREGSEALVREQDRASGAWQGLLMERDRILATSFAVLFLARGRAPVLIHKLRHGPADDWNHDTGDVANLVGVVGRDWKVPLNWQVIDARTATVADLLRAPILFFNGHQAPELSLPEMQKLRDYVDQGGVLFADACCSSPWFDPGFRFVMKQLFPEDDAALRPIPDDHPIWRARHPMEPRSHMPLLGISRGGRMAVIYSPYDVSCYWNQIDQAPTDPLIGRAIQIGQNVVDHVTGRRLPPDKLAAP